MKKNLSLLFVLLAGFVLSGTMFFKVAAQDDSQMIAPDAGTWHTWLLETADQFEVAPPPDEMASAQELAQLMEMAGARDDAAQQQIAYWDAGPPSYRWNQIAVEAAEKRGIPGASAGRVLALVHVAIYDATIAAWDAKYTFNRSRPAVMNPDLMTAIPTPQSPSYPSEYAVTAAAASTVLAWLFPNDAEFFAAQAQEAMQSRLLAGVEYPSDMEAGMALGQQIAALAIAHGEADGSSTQWTGTVPVDPTGWTGQNPVAPQSGQWVTWALSSSDQFRPTPPPAFDSEQLAVEMDELRAFERTPVTNGIAMNMEFGGGSRYNHVLWNDIASRLILESRQDANAPAAARVYALMNIAGYDALVACFEAKYAYWAIRPFQYDPAFTTVFPTPNHPSYPAAHSCHSTAYAAVLAEIFPTNAESLMAKAHLAGESRLWAGVHFRSDIVAGAELGMRVAEEVLTTYR